MTRNRNNTAQPLFLRDSRLKHTLSLYLLRAMSVVHVFDEPGDKGLHTLAFTPDGSSIVSANRHNIFVHSTCSYELRALLQNRHPAPGIECFAITSDSGKVVFVTEDAAVKSWTMCAGDAAVCKFRVRSGISVIAPIIVLTPDDQFILMSTTDIIEIHRMDNNTYVRPLVAPPRKWCHFTCVAVSPDCQFVVASSVDSLYVWTFASGITKHTIQESAPNNHAIVSADSKLILAARADSSISIYCIYSGNLTRKLEGYGYAVFHIAISPDSRFVAYANGNDFVRLAALNKPSAKPLRMSHKSFISATQVAFHPNSILFASVSKCSPVTVYVTREWSDRIHHLFSKEFKALVFSLMCTKARLDARTITTPACLPCLPMAVWLNIFLFLQHATCV